MAIFTLDIKRQENHRLDIICCVQTEKRDETSHNDGLLYKIFKEFYAPFLLRDVVRGIVVVVFSAWFAFSLASLPGVPVGLDEKLSMPEDSYLIDYFNVS